MKLALYAGTFDPFTLGHLDIIRQGLRVFDRIIITLANNSAKKTLLTLEERKMLIEASVRSMDRVSVDVFDGLLIDFARAQHASSLIRGLRQVMDFDYELRMAVANRRLAPELTSVLFLPSETHVLTSSSLVREIYTFGGDVSSFVPEPVNSFLEKKREEKI